ncbi:MAG TPA: ATP-grasp domain-containing protein [Allosphingosinicella sp.]
MTALILADDLGVFLPVARSLGRRGVEVHVVPAELDSPGLLSRYVAATHLLPAYRAAPGAWVEALRGLIERHDFRLVIPCSDDSLRLLDHHSEDLGRERLALPNRAAFDAFTDKLETRALAARLGVPVADGAPVEPGEDLEARLGLPLVLKPVSSYRVGDLRPKEFARIVRTPPELERWQASNPAGNWLAEAFVPGEGVGLSVLARQGEVMLAAQHRRLHTLSETGGSSVRVSEAVDPRLMAAVRSLAGATGLHGVAMFEFRMDRASGRYALIEVNARFWGSLPLAVAAGADFPAALWDLLTQGRGTTGAARPGVVKRNMTGEYERLGEASAGADGASKVKAVAAALAFLPGLLSPRRFDSWAADDPAPFLAERRALLGRLAARVGKRTPTGALEAERVTS